MSAVRQKEQAVSPVHIGNVDTILTVVGFEWGPIEPLRSATESGEDTLQALPVPRPAFDDRAMSDKKGILSHAIVRP